MKLTADWLNDTRTQRLFSAFEAHGHTILFVGGCVRNALLNCAVSDIDVSTSATPDQTIAVAKSSGFKSIPTGYDHGTVTIVIDGHPFEITSFRKDVETHGRRAVVEYSEDINDDALRRDFTMNALYADRTGQVIDPLDGMNDLHARRVRFIATAQDRIQEDYLRILRYFRFFAWYADQDEGMDAEAMSAIANNVEGLSLISKERVGVEMQKILSADDPVRAISAMENCGVLAQILPASNARALGPLVVLEHSLDVPKDWKRRLLALGGQEHVEQLRLSKAESKRIGDFKRAMDQGAGPAETAYRYGRDTALDLALVTAASLATHVDKELLSEIEIGCSAIFPIKSSDFPKTIKGKAMGTKLRRIEANWIASRFSKSKDILLAEDSV